MPSPFLALKPSPQGRGGSICPFRIDSKTFSFSFDGGRADSYAIHECRWNINSSVWMSRKGLEWILACFVDIRDWVLGKDLFCKRFRANNKLFEFWGRSNKAGIFVEIAVYYGGASRGWVLVPASSNRSGWCLFSKELDSFLSGSNTARVVGRFSDAADGGGPTDGVGQNKKKLVNSRTRRKLRKFEFPRAVSGNKVLKGVSGVSISSKNGRPMCDFTFEVTPATLALRVSISNGEKRVVKWKKPYSQLKSNNSGPVIFNITSGHVKAHLAYPNTKAHREVSFPLGLGASGLGNQTMRVLGESLKSPMELSVPLAMPEALMVGGSLFSSTDQDSEILLPIPSRVMGYLVAGNALPPCRSSDAVVLAFV